MGCCATQQKQRKISHQEEKQHVIQKPDELRISLPGMTLNKSNSQNIANSFSGDDTIQQLQKQLDQKLKVKAQKDTQIASLYFKIGFKYHDYGEYQKSIQCYKKALQIFNNHKKQQKQNISTVNHNLGVSLAGLGECQQAKEYLQKALSQRIQLYGESHSDTAATYNELGHIYEFWDVQAAMNYYEKSLRVYRNLGNQQQHEAGVLNNIANILFMTNQNQQASDKYKQSLSIKQKIHGQNSFQVAITRYNMAINNTQMKQYSQSLENYDICFRIVKKVNLWNHPERQKWQTCYFQDIQEILKEKDIPKEIYQKAHKVTKQYYPSYHAVLLIQQKLK